MSRGVLLSIGPQLGTTVGSQGAARIGCRTTIVKPERPSNPHQPGSTRINRIAAVARGSTAALKRLRIMRG